MLFGISGLHKAQLKTPIIIKLLRSSDSREEINDIMGLIHQRQDNMKNKLYTQSKVHEKWYKINVVKMFHEYG